MWPPCENCKDEQQALTGAAQQQHFLGVEGLHPRFCGQCKFVGDHFNNVFQISQATAESSVVGDRHPDHHVVHTKGPCPACLLDGLNVQM